ncbi:nuclear pore complex protein GP210 isoform X1 [Momordica charantia]|uniref:Nuclear pore complex protein GP210 isoform X1 n=1 Tax=Momordica charantia TaxID=3673 RepID=A0A6J1DE25_MOMCH|nr:nuclear pore complex protein GP210 isoform X1 [Momordica charantia]
MLNFAIVLLVLLLMMGGSRGMTPHFASGPHIADVNILLPPKMTNPVEYRLQGSDGCFKWSWDHHDILYVLPEYNVSSHCSTSALLRSVAPYSGRKETAVYAADVQTGIVIRCKVFIDKISRIQIFHNSIKLDLDGLATLRVRAFDSEENVFSSLVGLQFLWHLIPETHGSPHHLAHLPLKDSPLSDCGGLCGDLNIQIKLEDSGVFSDLFVVRGIEIGHEVVSVHLLEPHLKHMADKIVLTVAEAMSLEPPSPVFVLVGATVRYSLKVIRANIPQVVTLPSSHYRWSTSNSSIAHVDSNLGLTSALRFGVTAVIVEDTRVVGHIQMSSLNVVMPESLHWYISPLPTVDEPVEEIERTISLANWYIVSGRQYLIQMKVFSRGTDAQEIYITESDDAQLHDNQTKCLRTYLLTNDLVPKHKWRTSRILQAISKGQDKLTASLAYYGSNYETKEVLKIIQEVVICEQVRLSLDNRSGISRSILIPWTPSVYQEVLLEASGGCAKTSSDYKWFSTDRTVVTVSASGVVQAKKTGKATVKVQSIFDSSNYDEVVIEVALPASMMILPSFPVETVVGSYLQAAVTMQSSNGVYFYCCDAFNSHVKWKVESESFKIQNKTWEMPVLDVLENVDLRGSFYGPPCSWTSVYASGSGHTTLQATLYKEYQHFDLSFHGPIVLRASLQIAAYPPLLVGHMDDGSQFGGFWVDLTQPEADSLESLDKLHLVPGTRSNVMLRGGPENWGKGVEFIETVEILDEEPDFGKGGVFVHQVSENYGSYQIICQRLGTYKLRFKRGNLVGDGHPTPAIAEVLVSVMCRLPSSIVLIADEPVNKIDIIRAAVQADWGSTRYHAASATVANGRTIRIAAVGISDLGEPFANSSSLHLRWELSSCGSLAYWDELYGSKRSKYGWERFLSLQNESGECIVRATVTGFSDAVREDYSAQLRDNLDNLLTDAIRLQLVSTLRVRPEYNLLFFNPDLKVNVSIIGGSCFLDAAVNDSRIVEVIQPAPGIQCRELVLSPKGMGTALVTVYDIGLSPPLSSSAVVHVADVDWIKISSEEEISLLEEGWEVVELAAGISDGSTFDSSQFVYMHILVHIEDRIVELVDNDDSMITDHGMVKAPSFKIKAVSLGTTTLYVSILQQSGREILSEPIKIEVYAPPRVHPNDIFLLPGASYMLTVKGGPTVGTYVEYASLDNSIVNVHKSSGQLSAVSSGKCNISATFYRNGGSVICQVHGNVKVGIPSNVVLNVQNEQLGVGSEMPIYPLFPEGDVFSFYQLCKGYNWTIDDEKVLRYSLPERFNGRGYRPASTALEDVQFVSYINERDLGFINMVYGRSAGIANIAVSFLCELTLGSNIETKFFNASASLSVIPNLPLALGVPITWILPPYYTTTKALPSSMDSYGHWDSQSRKRTITYSLLRCCGEKDEDAWKDAISIHGDRIKTSESNNIACIQAKDRSSGRMEIAACVRVAEVAQIRLRKQEFPFHVINLSVGTVLSLPISYYDSLGNLFHEAHDVVHFDVETNYPHIVSINYSREGNGYIYLKAEQHGTALVQVSIDKNPEKSDYILISVGALIYPHDPVIHVGSHLNFSIKGFNDQISGRWTTTNESVLSVDMLAGIAEAVGPGSTEVLFEGSNLTLRTTVTVQTGYTLSVVAPVEILTNVPFPGKGYNFSVNFSKSGTLLNDKRVLHDCRVDPLFVGYAKPWLDLDYNNSYCLFFPYSPEHLARLAPKSKAMRPDITVSIYASSREARQISGSASALFIGGFSVMEMGKSATQLNLTPDSNKTVITILGNTDVDLHWHEQDLVVAGPISKEESGIGGRTEYEVKAMGTKRFKDKILITLAANGQRTEIDVCYEPGEGDASGPTSNVTIWAIVLGALSLLMLTITLFMCFMDNPNRTQSFQPAITRTPTVTAPVTPDRSSPGISNEQSPRMPQPFVDYVRQTIDETPYYKREGRRRFNVQNTF